MTRQKVASFTLQDVFKITGRGLVFVGVITDGVIYIGNFIEFYFKGESLIRRISGMDMPSRGRTDLTAFLIACESEAELDAFRNGIEVPVDVVVWKED